MIKKIICFLVAALLINCITVSAATIDKTEILPLDTLKALNIVRGYDSEETKNFSAMKKSTFINFLMNIIDDGKYTSSYSSEALRRAEEIGIITSASGVSSQDDLHKNEAIRMAMGVLGYDDECRLLGGYPNGYLKKAQDIDLFSGVSLSEEVKNGEAFRILYNIIDSPVCEVSYTPTGQKFTENNDKKILEVYRDVIKIKGIVTSNDMSGLYTSKYAPVNYVTIDDVQYKDSDDILGNYLGCKVTAFAKKDSNDDYNIIYAEYCKNIEIIKFSTDDIEEVATDFKSIRYIEGKTSNKIKKAKISPSVSLLYNGIVKTDFTSADFADSGFVTLIDNDDDGVIDVIKLDVYENIIVSAIAGYDKIITGEFNYTGCLSSINIGDYEDTESKISYYKEGKPADFEDIEVGNVLSVYISDGAARDGIKIYISNKQLTSYIESIDNSEQELILDGTTYKISKSYYKANQEAETLAGNFEIGFEYTFYFDAYDEIVARMGKATGIQYGYVRRMRSDTDEDTLNMRIFGTDGEWRTLTFDKKVIVNGSSKKTLDNIVYLEQAIGGVVGYSLNAQGKVNKLELPTPYMAGIADERLNTVGANSGTFRYNNTTFDCKYYMTSDTKVIIVPKDAEMSMDETMYDIGNNYSFSSNVSVTYTGYNCDEYNCLGIVLVEKNETEFKKVKENTYLVREVRTVLNSDNEPTTQVLLASNTYLGLSVLADKPETLSGVKKGDIIKIHTNPAGYIDNISTVYKMSDGKLKDMSSDLYSKSTVKGVILKSDPAGNRILVDSSKKIALMIPSTPIVIYDKDKDEVSPGSTSDITINDYIVADIKEDKVLTLYVFRNLN